MKRRQILLLSPYHGGSHQSWAEGYQRYSRNAVDLLTLPARFWKWRMHGGAITLARQFNQQFQSNSPMPDLILATDMLDLTTFLALTRTKTASIPVVLYMHENQLTYPLPLDGTTGPMRRQHGERDRHYGFINLVSMLAADRVYFNSGFHLDSCLDALAPFLRHYPEYNEIEILDLINSKSTVLPVGVDFERLSEASSHVDPPVPPLVLWNQRLEYDKNPAMFLNALLHIAQEGFPFRVAICGERFGKQGDLFDKDLMRLGSRVVHNGFAGDSVYRQLLREAAITISTAEHEFFGIGVVEAIYSGAFPLLPNRLSYPEIIPAAFHARCLYSRFEDLIDGLRWALSNLDSARSIALELATHVRVYDWRRIARQYDDAFDALIS